LRMRWKLTDGFPTNESSNLKAVCFLSILCRVTACEREPLHVVGHPDVVVGRIIETRMRCGSGNDRRQMWRKFFRSGHWSNPAYDPPHIATLPSQNGCFASHSTTSCPSRGSFANGSNSPAELPRPRTSTSANT